MQTVFSHKTRILGLDIVRSAAILFVLVAHFLNIYHFGVIGVELFFVLSGYLIGQILCKDVERTSFRGIDIVNFWRRRWYRTLPNYFVCLAVLILAWRAMHIDFNMPVWKYLLFVQNLIRTGEIEFFPTSWSLSVEEWAYLILPVAISGALLLNPRGRPKAVLIAAAAIVIVPTALRIVLAPTGNWDSVIRKVTLFRLDAIGYGVLLAYASVYRSDIMRRLQSPILAAVSIIVAMALTVNLGPQAQGPHGAALWKTGLWLSASSLSLIPIVAYAGTVVSSRNPVVTRLATTISTYSYSLYLWHLLVLEVVSRYWYLYHGALRRPLEMLVFALGSSLLSWLAYRIVEKPFMDLRNRTDRVGGTTKGTHYSALERPIGS